MSNNEVIGMEFVWDNFKRMFPDKAEHAVSYQRAGSRMILIQMDDGSRLNFLYYNPMNWNFGTKPWRMKPRQNEEVPG